MSDGNGVSVMFFCGAIKLLSRQHGPRMASGPMEAFRLALEEAETIYRSLPPEPKNEKRKRGKANA